MKVCSRLAEHNTPTHLCGFSKEKLTRGTLITCIVIGLLFLLSSLIILASTPAGLMTGAEVTFFLAATLTGVALTALSSVCLSRHYKSNNLTLCGKKAGVTSPSSKIEVTQPLDTTTSLIVEKTNSPVRSNEQGAGSESN